MAFAVRMQVANADEVFRKLGQAKGSLQRSILRAPMAKIGRLAVKEAKARAPVLKDRKKHPHLIPGLLKASIGSKVKTYKSGVVVAIIGPRSSYRATKNAAGKTVRAKNKASFAKAVAGGGFIQNPVKYTHLVELGTSTTTAQPFLRPALMAVSKVAPRILLDGVRAGLAKAVAGGKLAA